jgi:hypothetical protein
MRAPRHVLFSSVWVLGAVGLAWVLYRYWVERGAVSATATEPSVTLRAESPYLISRDSSPTT